MAELISFNDALAATEGQDRNLLTGNGFSARYFNYSNLLAASGLEEGAPLRNLFTALNTCDFEKVMHALEAASVVEKSYGNHAHADELTVHAQQVREALVNAVNSTHPRHREDLAFDFEQSTTFLKNFVKIFTMNYDLLLYWVALETGLFRDGFGLAEKKGGFLVPFREDSYCEMFNIHGGLHLFDNGAGEVMKALNSGEGVIEKITDTILNRRRLPIYVAEGTSIAKLRKINSVPYLRHCLLQLRKSTGSLFIYGHGAADNDAHIYQSVFLSDLDHVYFGVYRPDDDKIAAMDAQLARFQKVCRSKISYTFFPSESANVWEPAQEAA